MEVTKANNPALLKSPPLTKRDEAPTPTVDQIRELVRCPRQPGPPRSLHRPRAEIPIEYVDEILTKGAKLAGPWFADFEDVEHFHLPDAVADYVDGVLIELQRWWVGLSDEQRLRWADVESNLVPEDLQTSYPGLFAFVVGDEGAYADPQVVDFIAFAARRDE
ncbi:hypothetical protein F6X56_13795 [Rhodococcus erythropolis]|uniref:hypothetical protein n=1 Tax=Rhodococcus erythropolis TaxID=1833 RepID=UPI0012489D15|nr:hypothetical protein [Rhodococcus erythropolis]QEX10712.1 hypothetical protein F6X56_13795 [Rhodococcus erythropolis]